MILSINVHVHKSEPRAYDRCRRTIRHARRVRGRGKNLPYFISSPIRDNLIFCWNALFQKYWIVTISTILGCAGVDKDTLLECGKCPKGKSVSERIINGAQASLKQWPWVVGIYNSSDMMVCGGTLINRQYVLTAAHCFG